MEKCGMAASIALLSAALVGKAITSRCPHSGEQGLGSDTHPDLPHGLRTPLVETEANSRYVWRIDHLEDHFSNNHLGNSSFMRNDLSHWNTEGDRE